MHAACFEWRCIPPKEPGVYLGMFVGQVLSMDIPVVLVAKKVLNKLQVLLEKAVLALFTHTSCIQLDYSN